MDLVAKQMKYRSMHLIDVTTKEESSVVKKTVVGYREGTPSDVHPLILRDLSIQEATRCGLTESNRARWKRSPWREISTATLLIP